jgi:hypothetical protein
LKLNKTTLILITFVCVLGGLLLIYRGQQTFDSLYKFNGTVINSIIQEFPSHKTGYRYSLDFYFAETTKVYGIYLGTKEQAYNNDLKSKIEIGKTYTFYVDQTVAPSLDGHTLGIREIRNNKQAIYKDNPKMDYIGGSLFLIIGIGTVLILIYSDRRKTNAWN